MLCDYERKGWQAFLPMLPAFLMQHTVKMNWVNKSVMDCAMSAGLDAQG